MDTHVEKPMDVAIQFDHELVLDCGLESLLCFVIRREIQKVVDVEDEAYPGAVRVVSDEVRGISSALLEFFGNEPFSEFLVPKLAGIGKSVDSFVQLDIETNASFLLEESSPPGNISTRHSNPWHFRFGESI